MYITPVCLHCYPFVILVLENIHFTGRCIAENKSLPRDDFKMNVRFSVNLIYHIKQDFQGQVR